MSDQTSSPGAAWRKIVGEPDPQAFAAAFTAEVRLEMSASDGAIVDPMQLRAYSEASRTTFDRIEFTREITAGERLWLEWEGVFEGRAIAGATHLVRDAAGAIESVRIYQRPLKQVIAFAAALSRRLSIAASREIRSDERGGVMSLTRVRSDKRRLSGRNSNTIGLRAP